jgi:nucleotide sugar dehydrogenase
VKPATYIGVIGCGKVGLSHLSWLYKEEWNVIGFDPARDSQKRISKLLGKTGLARDFDDLANCTAVHICVPTDPAANGSADLAILEETVANLARLERSGSKIRIVSQRSTCPPGTADVLSKQLRASYGVNPSFLRKSMISADTESPERLAFAGPPDFMQHMKEVYKNVQSPEFASDSRSIVELLKYAENAIDAVLISLWNEIFSYSQRLEIPPEEFCHLLSKIGERPKFAASARVPGRAFGMWCLPKDLRALIHEIKTHGCPVGTIAGALETNEFMNQTVGEGDRPGTQLIQFTDGQTLLSDVAVSQLLEFPSE